MCALDACARLAPLVTGAESHEAVEDSGCKKDAIAVNALIHMYGNFGNLQKGRM